jgi:apoptosis-inducing factor 3
MDKPDPSRPDFFQGIELSKIPDNGMLAGTVGDRAVLLARRGGEVFALGAECSHYHGPLGEGLLAGETVRCPWHHACFSLRTGEAVRAPAFDRVDCWRVERQGDRLFVRERIEVTAPAPASPLPKSAQAQRIVIVGGGAAGFAAAEMLRRRGFDGSLTMLSAEDDAPCDRPNLSKDYLAGNAPEDWLPLRPAGFYGDRRIDLQLGAAAAGIDLQGRAVRTADGRGFAFDKLLLATGAEPVRLPIPGAELPHVHVLRSTADCRAIIAGAGGARRAVVIGASFIGLEVAASLRARKLEVHVVAPERVPMERVLGPQFGRFVRALHEEHGVVFHLEDSVAEIGAGAVKLTSGASLDADLVVAGVGVRPRIELAQRAGLKLDRGVVVDPWLETSAPGVFAAGDIARWPDARSGESIRVEHWVVAQRQGQAAARNMLGLRERFVDVPFFWSQHYDLQINYVGHAERWDELQVDGDIAARDYLVRFRAGGRMLAAASVGRDVGSLQAEIELEREAAP